MAKSQAKDLEVEKNGFWWLQIGLSWFLAKWKFGAFERMHWTWTNESLVLNLYQTMHCKMYSN